MKPAELEEQPLTTDQTEFTTEEPIFVDSYQPESPQPQSAPQSKLAQYKWPLIGGGVLMVILLLIVVAAALNRPQVNQPIVVDTPKIETPAELKPFEREINTLKAELKEADPARQDLPFPAVNLQINLEDKRI